MEKWIEGKNFPPKEFPKLFGALLESGLVIRNTLLLMRSSKGDWELNKAGFPTDPKLSTLPKLIFGDALYETEEQYTFNLALSLALVCNAKSECTNYVVKLAISCVGTLIKDGKIVLTKEMQTKVMSQLQNFRCGVLWDVIYFFKL